MVESVYVPPQIHQPREIFQGDLSRKLGHINILRLWTHTPQLQNWWDQCMWLQQHVQEFNSSFQGQMQQYRKAYIGNTQQKFKRRTQQHFGKVQKASQAWWEFRLMVLNILQCSSMIQLYPQPTNAKESTVQ